ncbi:MAG: hypothetical protein QF893_06910 [Alphaproteobacteria bacterium]|nr:hypothetical protein [Alphaproteobacteria bacterium]
MKKLMLAAIAATLLALSNGQALAHDQHGGKTARPEAQHQDSWQGHRRQRSHARQHWHNHRPAFRHKYRKRRRHARRHHHHHPYDFGYFFFHYR